MKRLLRALVEQDGATAVEYAVMLGLILLVLLGSAAFVGIKTGGMWTGIQTTLTDSGALK
jgi:pilus assembly protein Flp/PilA